MFIQHTVVAFGNAFVSVSVMVGFAAVVVPVLIVLEHVWPLPCTAVTVAEPVDCHPAERASSAFVQTAPLTIIGPRALTPVELPIFRGTVVHDRFETARMLSVMRQAPPDCGAIS